MDPSGGGEPGPAKSSHRGQPGTYHSKLLSLTSVQKKLLNLLWRRFLVYLYFEIISQTSLSLQHKNPKESASLLPGEARAEPASPSTAALTLPPVSPPPEKPPEVRAAARRSAAGLQLLLFLFLPPLALSRLGPSNLRSPGKRPSYDRFPTGCRNSITIVFFG